MTYSILFRCDACGATMASFREATDWWMLRLNPNGGILAEPWFADKALEPEVFHYCGPPCLGKAVTRSAEILPTPRQMERLMSR